MNRAKKASGEHKKRKGGKMIPALCNVLGTMILAGIFFACIPVTVPRFFGYEIYQVLSGSMEPEIPVGSAVYVKAVSPGEIEEGDIVAFLAGESIITHRVVKNYKVEGKFETKGDANEEADMNRVPYEAVRGKVAFHIPELGRMEAVIMNPVGKAYLVCFAACGAMFNMLAGRLRERV